MVAGFYDTEGSAARGVGTNCLRHFSAFAGTTVFMFYGLCLLFGAGNIWWVGGSSIWQVWEIYSGMIIKVKLLQSQNSAEYSECLTNFPGISAKSS